MTEQTPQFPPEIAQQLSMLNMRVGNVNLSMTDLVKEMDKALKAMAAKIAELQKENAELKKPKQ
ncbi:MAG: hypothetical protein NWF01_09660 [Candidatus Bathyarchaeota archaeon]|nr:hypothetical protein [Candidatus Bathyarchaeota archaeon]